MPDRTAEIVEVAAFVGVIGDSLPEGATPFELGEFSGPDARRLRREGVDVIYVPRREKDKPAPAEGEVALVWGRAFRGDDTRLTAGDRDGNLDSAHLDGKFMLGRIGARRVELHTDCIAASPCYYCERGGIIYFGSHIGALLRVLPHRPKLNDLGIAEMIFFGGQLFDETPYSGIYRLPAGRSIELEGPDAGGVVQLRNRPAFEVADLVGREAPPYTPETVLEMADLGVRREDFGVQDALLLSSGRDSLLLALAKGAPRNAIVYGQWYTLDRVGGERRAGQLGMRLLPFAHRRWDLTTYMPLLTRLFGGLTAIEAGGAIVGIHGLKRRPPLAASGNFGGRTLLGKRHPQPEATSAEEAVSLQFQNCGDPIGAELFGEERAHIMATMHAWFEDYRRNAETEVAVRLLSWRVSESRRFTFSKDALDWFAPLSAPYLNRGFLNMVMNAPPAAMADRSISNAAIRSRLVRYPVPLRYRMIKTYPLAKARSRLVRARAVGQVYWPHVLDRSPIEAADLVCGHDRLDEYMQRSFAARHDRRGSAIPRFMFAAGLAVAARRFAA